MNERKRRRASRRARERKRRMARRIAAIDNLIAFAGVCAFAYVVCLMAELLCRLAGCG